MALRSVIEQYDPSSTHVVQVAVGLYHVLLLTDEGVVFSWGVNNDYGQLGRQSTTDGFKTPDIVHMYPPGDKSRREEGDKSRREEVVVAVACGSRHSLALTMHGRLLAWGTNKAGQLGVDGFDRNAPKYKLSAWEPTPVRVPNGAPVQSCSCGPESSACVTSRGEVFVWGALSYHLFGNGTQYAAKESCTVPVKVRDITDITRRVDILPNLIACCKKTFACTLAPFPVEKELEGLVASLKDQQFRRQAERKQQLAEFDGAAAGNFEVEDLTRLMAEWRLRKLELEKRLRAIEDDGAVCTAELKRVDRDLTICYQQDTYLAERRNRVEANINDNQSRDKAAQETEMNDIGHLRQANRRGQQELLDEQDKLVQQQTDFNEEHVMKTHERSQVVLRLSVLRHLGRGQPVAQDNTVVSQMCQIVAAKRKELADTDPQLLAGAGQFTGLCEVLAISDRALHNVSSSINEVSGMTHGNGDGVIFEEVLGAQLKLRREYNRIIRARLDQAYESLNHAGPNKPSSDGRRGTSEITVASSSPPRPRGSPRSDAQPMNGFFHEARMLRGEGHDAIQDR